MMYNTSVMAFEQNVLSKAQNVGAKDIMSFGGFSGGHSTGIADGMNAFLDKMTQVDSSKDMSVTQRVLGQKPQTVAQTVLPKDNFQVSVNQGALVRNASAGPAKDGQQAGNSRAQSQKDVDHEIGRLTASLKDAQRQANAVQGEVAADFGVDKNKAARSFASTPAPTEIGAGLTIVCDMATGGGGTFATILMEGGTVYATLNEKDRKCSHEEQEKILDNELVRLQSGRQGLLGGGGGKPVFDDADTGTLRDLHALNFDKLHVQVPEMAQLHQEKDGLEKVEDNHKALQNRPDCDFGDVQIASASVSGIISMNIGSQVLQFDSVSPIGASLAAAAPQYDNELALAAPTLK